MRDVFKVPVEDEVSLAIDQDGERYVFSMMYGDMQLRDLWDYSAGSLPEWILHPDYRL